MNKENEIIERMLHTAAPMYIRENADGTQSRTITGYAVLFNTPSAVLWSWDGEDEREIIAQGAITRELLDASDIKMTMFHDNKILLGRSNKGVGTLKYNIDERGVSFEFDAPNTTDGDKALELVRRGDIAGCSFAFSTKYRNRAFVEPTVSVDADGKKTTTYTVRTITGIYDFTLTDSPAYPDTSCEARAKEFFKSMRQSEDHQTDEEDKAQKEELRRAYEERKKQCQTIFKK